MSDEIHPSLDDPTAWVPYRYEPSKVAAIIFVVLFALSTVFHIYQLFKKRTWYFIPLIIGGIFESLGYIGRIISTSDIWALGPFIMQSILLLVAPALFAASIYIILGRIILLTDGERHSLIRQKWLTKIFVAGDVLSFLVQSGGGGIQAMKTLTSMHTGQTLIIVGLFMQLAFFGLFVVVAGLFHWRLIKAGSSRNRASDDLETSGFASKTAVVSEPTRVSSSQQHLNINNLPWKRHLYALYGSSALILVRSLFRVIEYLQGNSGYLLKHEVFLYVFDAILMLAVMVLFNWIHPSEVTDAYEKRIAGGEGEVFESQAGMRMEIRE